MPKENQIIEAGGVKVAIKHPGKILFPEANITKNDLVLYYTAVWPYLCAIGRGRPLAVKRFPQGVGAVSFFQKNKPGHAPDWITSRSLGIDKKADYILLDKLATLLWLVNLDTLEFHSTLVAAPYFSSPDLMVFDLDPPPEAPFTETRDFALACRPVIESFGYQCFVKTSGKKGVHLCCPILQKWGFEQVFTAAREVAQAIIQNVPGCTLELKKEKRKNNILVDIYRNHPYQLMAIPLGTRATPLATVSMPLRWETLATLEDPAKYTARHVPSVLKTEGFAWKDFGNAATGLHGC